MYLVMYSENFKNTLTVGLSAHDHHKADEPKLLPSQCVEQFEEMVTMPISLRLLSNREKKVPACDLDT